MSNPVNVICMKWGDKYDASYVNKLHNMVSRNLAREFRFICLTDDNSGLSSAIEAFDIPKLNLPKGIPERGWTKLVTFSKNIFDINHYFELEVCHGTLKIGIYVKIASYYIYLY